MAMPERIWAVRLPKFKTARDQGVTVAATSECLVVPPPDDATEYVLATTHQRTLEAIWRWQRARLAVVGTPNGDATFRPKLNELSEAEDALARIKETNDG